ncbi:innexin unc-9-like [Mytilus californianus]|uniref:innexin unc-9-like n=1 Tax=Mytilus californianus TaxID=6549 RepID=UPI002248684E|nr:innexin unc-9-like [Mytilus californianus]
MCGILAKFRGRSNGDWIDRMSHVYTTSMFIIFTFVVGFVQFFKDPIQCWTPAEFTDSMVSYTKNYCWVQNTFYVPMFDQIPGNISESQDAQVTYYQWVPLILIFMAFLFKLPNVVWRIFNGGSGMDLDNAVQFAEESQLVSIEDQEISIKSLANFMDKWLIASDAKNGIAKQIAAKYLVILYLFVKILYVLNAIGQIFLLNAFLSTSFNFYGFEFLENLSSNRPWRESPRFPRVILCNFQIRQLHAVQIFTVQCVLPINLFNEKIFIFIWFWLVFIAILAVFNLFMWIKLLMLNFNKTQNCKKYLKINNALHTSLDKQLCDQFAENYMREDGVFVLRMIAINSTDLVVTDQVKELWELYKNKQSTVKNDEAKELKPEMVMMMTFKSL